MWLRSCSKCGGDLFLRELDFAATQEEGIVEVVCLQCGRIVPPDQADQVVKQAGIADAESREVA